MLYTVGHRENYLKTYRQCQAEGVQQLKCGRDDEYEGGFVTNDPADCIRIIQELFAKRADQFNIFGLIGVDYETDTWQKESEWFRRLTKDAEIVPLEKVEAGE